MTMLVTYISINQTYILRLDTWILGYCIVGPYSNQRIL